MQAVRLFYCYAHEDKSLQEHLVKHLDPLERQGLIAGWSDRDLSAGRHWQNEIDERLNTADLILLLISPSFIDSDYCYSVEVMDPGLKTGACRYRSDGGTPQLVRTAT